MSPQQMAGLAAAAALGATLFARATAPPVTLHYEVAAATSMSLTGSVDSLYPGATRSLTVVITNQKNFAFTVDSATVVAGAATADCDARYVTVGSIGGVPLTVAARSSVAVSVPVTLALTAPDACQQVQFPLTFSATAVKG